MEKNGNMQLGDYSRCGVVVSGHARSGTTLLVSLLDNHPQLLVLPVETKFFSAVASGKFDKYIFHKRCFSNFKVGNKLKGYEPPYDYNELVSSYLRSRRGNLKERFVAIIGAFHEQYLKTSSGAKLKSWVEKTPAHWKYFPLLKAWFPGARLIHVYRDPRDVYASWKKKNPASSVRRFCKGFLKMYSCMKLLEKDMKSVLVVRYEDMVTETKQVMKKVCDFLGIVVCKEVLVPTVLGEPYMGNSSHVSGQEGVSQKSIGTFNESLTCEDIKEIEEHLQAFMVDMRYPFTLPVDRKAGFRRNTSSGVLYRLFLRMPDLQKLQLGSQAVKSFIYRIMSGYSLV